MTAPTISDLRVTQATLRALQEAAANDADGAMYCVAAGMVARHTEREEAALAARIRGQQWAAEQRHKLGRGR